MTPATLAIGVRVALLNQGAELKLGQREALAALGADIVYEAAMIALDRTALAASRAQAIVVNLGADDEPSEEIHDLASTGDYAVVINDAEGSIELGAAAQVRWARLLAGKILQRPDFVLPPRPLGAEAIPGAAPFALSSDSVQSMTVDLAAEAAAKTGAGFADRDFVPALEGFNSTAAAAPADSAETLRDFETLFAAASAELATMPASSASELPPPPPLSESEPEPALERDVPVAAPNWSLSPLQENEPDPPAASEFGIETIPVDVYLAPQVDAAPERTEQNAEALDFDLVPLDDDAAQDPIARELADALRERARTKGAARAADSPSPRANPPDKTQEK
jgi:hypothetical protein